MLFQSKAKQTLQYANLLVALHVLQPIRRAIDDDHDYIQLRILHDC